MCEDSDSKFLRELGDRVKTIRIEKGKSCLDIAVLSKVNRTHLYKIENGELNGLIRRPALETTTPGLLQSIDACSKGLEFEGAYCGKGDPIQGAPVWHGGANAVRLRNIVVK